MRNLFKTWNWLFLLPAGILLYGIFAGVNSPEITGKTIRLGHVLNQQHPVHLGMRFMADDLQNRSGGSLRIEIYPDEQLGTERELTELMQIGSVGMTKVSAAQLEAFSPVMSVYSLPFLFRDREHFWRVAESEIGEELLDASLPYRLKGLAYYDAGARSFYLSKRINREIRSPADLEGLTIRVQQSKTAVRLIEVLGAKPVPIPFGELYTALDTGAVDGAENNPPSLFTTRQYEVASSYSLNEHTIVPDVLLMSRDVWERLSPQEQAWVKESARASSRFQRELWRQREAENLAEMERAGLKIVRDVNKQAFREKAQAIYNDAQFRQPEIQRLIQRIQAVQ
jgi:tripartite ATP-independent transporter DctP family solute receptor